MAHTTLRCPYLLQKRQFLAGKVHEIVLWPNDFESCWQNTQNINSSLSGSQELGTLYLIVIRFLLSLVKSQKPIFVVCYFLFRSKNGKGRKKFFGRSGLALN